MPIDKKEFIINNINIIHIEDRIYIAKLIWNYNKNSIEEKCDGLLIKFNLINDKLINKIYKYVKTKL